MKVDPKWLKAASSRLPSSAKLIDALYRVIQQPDIDVDHLVRLVSMDTAITSRLLRMANSASYTRGEHVTSLDQALTWLGAFQAYRVACITVTAKLCEQNLPIYRISADRLLGHTIAMAVGMEVIAKQTSLDPKAAYTLGILHNLGRIVLQRVALQMEIPAGAGDLPNIHGVINWERETFGCTHGELGGSVLALWGMNPLLSQVFLHQHDVERIEDTEVRRWGALLHLTSTVVASTEFGLGVTGDSRPITEALFVEAGLEQLDILQLSDEIAGATKTLCEQSGFVLNTGGGHPLSFGLDRVI
jgi:HD-like signal output (HDOD) protein